jgi:2-iminobutanoate/2-iminopropanoate deaminase
MSLKKVGVFTDEAPTLRPGVYTPAIVANGFVFTSGVLGADPITKKMVPGTVIDRFVRRLFWSNSSPELIVFRSIRS